MWRHDHDAPTVWWYDHDNRPTNDHDHNDHDHHDHNNHHDRSALHPEQRCLPVFHGHLLHHRLRV